MALSSDGSHDNATSADYPAYMEAADNPPSKILIVDDEPDIIDEVTECLEGEGLGWVSAQNAEDAIELVESDDKIGIVVTDIRMPGMDGLELSRRLLEKYGSKRDLYIIVVTGHAGMREAIEALQIGAEDFLTKPISPDQLLHSIHRAEEMIHLRSAGRFYKEHLKHEVKKKTAAVRQLAAELEEQNRELAQKNEDLTVVNRLKDEFLQMMSHELNTPLNAISGFSQLLVQLGEESGDEQVIKFAEHIFAGSNRLTKTLDSFLALAMLRGGSMKLSYANFSAGDLLTAINREYASVLSGLGGTLNCELPDPSFDLDADCDQLRKAINRLLDNGANYGGSTLVLKAYQDGESACFSIADDGKGMTPEQIVAALEPMRQVDGSMGRHVEGVGVGLPLAKGIVDLHGGRLDIQSSLGEGTTITISLPRAGLETASKATERENRDG